MGNMKSKIKKELKALTIKGHLIYTHEQIIKKIITGKIVEDVKKIDNYKKYLEDYISLTNSYQSWYSKSLRVISQLLPDRYDEFILYYKNEKRKDINYLTYTINDYLQDLTIRKLGKDIVDTTGAFFTKFENQLAILESGNDRIDNILSNIKGILQSELFDNELEASKDLLKKKHIRASGILVGVTLETHLSKVCKSNKIKFKKKNPTISDFNEELKKAKIADIPTWRLIQRLGDIRNMCAHPKEREPKIDEIEDLIRGTEKLISEIN